jgi:membrane AbrB-like protein
MEKIIITLLLATAGGLAGYKIGFPAGAFIGAMVFVTVYNLITSNAIVHVPLKIAAQIILGAAIGTGLTLRTLKGFKELLIPILIFLTLLFIFSIISAFVLSKFTHMDIATAFFSCCPGGLTEMTIIADSYKANAPIVALIHISRILSVILIYPLIVRIFIK